MLSTYNKTMTVFLITSWRTLLIISIFRVSLSFPYKNRDLKLTHGSKNLFSHKSF